jgi:Asp-tRNA(Asn)/Glu-tRNA(Gln) amidotransferase A subunit family amidase
LEATLTRIDERNPSLGAIVDLSANEAARMLAEAPEGPLHGVPVAIKDQFALPWRAPRDGCSKNLFGIEAGESVMYQRLRDAGAVIVGVTNMHELGLGSTGHVSIYGPVGTPWNPAHCGGGSSGGSASAVGGRLVAGAVGTDGGGSVRIPAAYCGVTGLKLTWGRIPPGGYTHGSASLGTAGPFCRDAADARALASAMLALPLTDRRTEGLRIGVPEALWEDLTPEVAALCREALGALQEAGLQTGDVKLPGTELTRIATVLMIGIETSPAVKPGALAELEATLSPLGRALARYQLLVPAPAYKKAEWVRFKLRRSLADAFDDFDLIACPTTPAPAPPIENPTVELPSGPQPADYANVQLGGIANLTGVPAISVPCGFSSDGLPVGLQLMAPWGEDERLLDVAEAFERATSRQFVDAVPPIAQEVPAA